MAPAPEPEKAKRDRTGMEPGKIGCRCCVTREVSGPRHTILIVGCLCGPGCACKVGAKCSYNCHCNEGKPPQ